MTNCLFHLLCKCDIESWRERVQLWIDCAASCCGVVGGVSSWEFCALHIHSEESPPKKEEAGVQEEDEKGEAEAGRLCSRRIDSPNS